MRSPASLSCDSPTLPPFNSKIIFTATRYSPVPRAHAGVRQQHQDRSSIRRAITRIGCKLPHFARAAAATPAPESTRVLRGAPRGRAG